MNPFGKKRPPVMPPWHPDFRDPTTLPDVKSVRTSFFVNGFAFLVLALVVIYLGIQEYARHNLKDDIRVLEARISQHSSRNDQVVRLHRNFQTEEKFIKQIADYLDESLEMSEFLMALSETLYPEMMLSTLRYQEVTDRGNVTGMEMILNGVIRAAPDVAASIVTEYLNTFYEHPFFVSVVQEAVPTSLVPTTEGNKMAFGIRLVLSTGNKESQGK